MSESRRPTQFGRIHATDETWLATQPPEPIPRLNDDDGAGLEAAFLRQSNQLSQPAFLAVLVLVPTTAVADSATHS